MPSRSQTYDLFHRTVTLSNATKQKTPTIANEGFVLELNAKYLAYFGVLLVLPGHS